MNWALGFTIHCPPEIRKKLFCGNVRRIYTIAAAGWARRDVQSYLYERTRLPARVLHGAFEVTQYRPWLHAMGDGDLVPLCDHPEKFRVLVAGGPGKHSCVVPSWGMTRSVTLPIEP